MGFMRGLGAKSILLAACVAFATPSFAACTGAHDLVEKLRAQPTSENAVVLGP